ncbi:hypothetical protein SUGI_0762140 [Cryptomeria japonica]|nr:hypothetical protein SUGI_0762140 [Cryptomeria japonica]
MEIPGKWMWMSMIMFFMADGIRSTVNHAIIHSNNQAEKQNVSVFEYEYHPQVFFELNKPLDVSPVQNICSVMVLQHDFVYTYNKPPITAAYIPPKECMVKWSRAVLEWKATSKGRQFDRIAAVWLSGIEILRTSTAEPTKTGIEWTIEKDITKYSALLKTNQTLVVELGNLVDKTYTGIYRVNITFHFYKHPQQQDSLIPPYSSPADHILPISNSFPENVLEIFVSFHENDESWYLNPPNDYIEANNLTNMPGNGAFREVVVLIDGVEVSAVWPFPVIFTGGLNPLFWRPVVAIGAFDLPTYDLEITPFVGKLLDGKNHTFGLRVTDALNVWLVDANMHLWVDDKSARTRGKLIKYDVPSFKPKLKSNFKGLNGFFKIYADRQISYTGWVESSHGNITTQFIQRLKYINKMSFKNNGDIQIVDQIIGTDTRLVVQTPSKVILSTQVSNSFPMYLYFASVEKGNGTSMQTANLSMAIKREMSTLTPSGSSFSSLHNCQDAQGYIYVNNSLVTSGLGSTQQTYNYQTTEGCYFRSLSVSNSTFFKDNEDNLCRTISKASRKRTKFDKPVEC